MPRPEGADAGERRLQIVLGLLLVGLTAFTILAFFTPTLGVSVLSLPLDLIINTGATIAAGAVAALAWARYRETLEARFLLQSAAFLVLSSVNAVILALIASGSDGAFGFRLEDPGAMPIVAFVGARLAAAALLAAGGYVALRGRADRVPGAGWLVPVPALATLVLIGAAAAAGESVDGLLTGEAVQHLRAEPGSPLALDTVAPGLLLIQAGIGLLFLGAAWYAYRVAVRDGHRADAYVSAGLLLAAFSQLHYAVNPGSYLSVVTTGDLLRVAFYALMLAAIVAQTRTDVRALREANVELERLRDSEVDRALLEERARLAREVHDGLAQDLWYARLTQGRLAQMLEGEQERALAQDVMDAIDNGIADSRQTVMAMRAGSTDAPLLDVVERYVEDFGDRFALDARFEADGAQPALPPRTQAEVLRIVQEALNNVRKHADATVVRVTAGIGDGGLRIQVADNGRGFDPDAVNGGYGLAGMRERAALVGGQLEIESAPSDGTTITVRVPVQGGGR